MDKTVPLPAAKLLDFIGSIEAPKGYGTVYANRQHLLPKPLTQMTIGEVLAAGPTWAKKPPVGNGSSACGRYQFMAGTNHTLAGLARELKLRAGQVFNPDLQDRLGYHLLRRRGYDKWISGQMTDAAFMLELAKEWASFPVPARTQGAKRVVARGQSYYAGDGINKSLVRPEAVEATLAAAKALRGVTTATAPATVPPLSATTERETNMNVNPALVQNIAAAVIGALVRNPNVPIDNRKPNVVMSAEQTVTEVIETEVAPIIEHATNNEPWYKSRVTLGALGAIASGVWGLFLEFSAGQLDFGDFYGPSGVAIYGGATTIYGRWIARKPIGA